MFFSLKVALHSLRTHRLRTILAMTGVLLGALALTGVQNVSRAMYAKAEAETAKLGTNLFIARTGQVSFRRTGSARVGNESRTFTLRDAQALMAGLPAANRGAPFVSTTMAVRAGDIKIPAQLVATWPDYREVRNLDLISGRFLSDGDLADRERVVVLGDKIARRLFGRPEKALGETVLLFRAPVRVIGVLAPKGADIVGADQDEQIFVPLSTYLRRFANQTWITGIYIQLADPAAGESSKKGAEAILRKRHGIGPGKKDDFSVLTARDTIQVQQQALQLVQTLGLISSSVSFAVGGLGILSIMILLVRTRRLEIGIRRAVGARRLDIVRQFVFEAGMMAGMGGAWGVVLAWILVFLVAHFGDMPLIFDPLLMLAVLAGAVLLGVAAGVYPAWQAGQVEVLEVLRKE